MQKGQMERQIEGQSVVFIIINQLHSMKLIYSAVLIMYLNLKYYDSQHPLHAQLS